MLVDFHKAKSVHLQEYKLNAISMSKPVVTHESIWMLGKFCSVYSNKALRFNKMEIFKTNVKYFATLGVTRHQAMQRQPFNAKIILQILKFCLCVILCGGFLIFKASNFQEYTTSILFTSACIAISIAFVAFARNMKYFFNFIDGWTIRTEES